MNSKGKYFKYCSELMNATFFKNYEQESFEMKRSEILHRPYDFLNSIKRSTSFLNKEQICINPHESTTYGISFNGQMAKKINDSRNSCEESIEAVMNKSAVNWNPKYNRTSNKCKIILKCKENAQNDKETDKQSCMLPTLKQSKRIDKALIKESLNNTKDSYIKYILRKRQAKEQTLKNNCKNKIGDNSNEVNNRIINIEGINFEVSSRNKNSISPSSNMSNHVSKQMNLINYDFNGSSFKINQSPKQSLISRINNNLNSNTDSKITTLTSFNFYNCRAKFPKLLRLKQKIKDSSCLNNQQFQKESMKENMPENEWYGKFSEKKESTPLSTITNNYGNTNCSSIISQKLKNLFSKTNSGTYRSLQNSDIPSTINNNKYQNNAKNIRNPIQEDINELSSEESKDE